MTDPGERGKSYSITLPPGRTRRFTIFPEEWNYTQNAELNTAPILLKETVAFVASNGTVYSFRQAIGQTVYKYINGYPVIAPLALLGRELFLASSDFSLYSIDLKNGNMKWRFPSGYPIHQAPIPFTEDVLVVSEGGGLTSVANRTGEPRWNNDAVVRVIAVSRDYVYGADRSNNVLVLSRKTGGLIGSLELPLFSVSPPNQFNDRLYLATADGLVVCLHEKGSPTPFLHPQVAVGLEEEVKPVKELAKKSMVATPKSKDEAEPAKPKPKPKPKKDGGGKKPGKDKDKDKGNVKKGKGDADN
jgi:hypothetical protein